MTALPPWGRALGLGLAAVVAAGALSQVGVASDLLLAVERKATDYRVARYRGPIVTEGTAPSEVVIVAIDEASVGRLGRFALWPRSFHAKLLDRLREAGVRTVAFDLLLTEADTLPEAVLEARADEIARAGVADPSAAARVLAGLGGDRLLAEAMRRAGDVWLAWDPATRTPPVQSLMAAAAGIGHVGVGADPDGIVRRVKARAAGGAPALAVAAARSFRGAPPEGDEAEPMPGEGEVLLDFLGPPGSFLTLSYADVLEGTVPPALLRDRLVFVGATAAGLGDRFATPFSPDMPGVEVHATLASQFLEGRWLRDGAAWAPWITLAATVPTAFVVSWLPPLAALMAALAVLAVLLVVSMEAFAQAGILLPLAFPALGWTMAALLTSAYRVGVEGRRRRETRAAFGRYVSPAVVDEISSRPELLRVGGEERVITVGFLDIRGFTNLSSRLAPEELASFLHAFFTVVEGEIHARRGTVDKYIGDAVMMLFGAPNELEDGPVRACETALAIVEAVEGAAKGWRAFGVEDLRIGVGLETGPAVVGNIGSERRFDYTALGDTVNVAARLQDLNKALGTTILLGPGVARRVRAPLRCIPKGSHVLRGRDGPIEVFELSRAPRGDQEDLTHA